MKVDVSSQLQALLTLDAGRPLVRPLAAGQILQAKVIDRSVDGSVTLADNRGTQMVARSALKLSVGEQLTLRVESLGRQPVLRLLTQPASDPVEVQALRRVLPSQQPLAPLLNQLRAVTQEGGSMGFHPPQELSAAARQVHAAVHPRADILVPSRLQQAVLNSGLFFESRLAAGVPGVAERWSVTQDLKAQLLRLSALLGNQPKVQPNSVSATTNAAKETGRVQTNPDAPAALPAKDAEPLRDLVRQTEGAIARIQVRQLSSAGAQASGVAAWHVEVPVVNNGQAEVLPLQFEREGDDSDPDQSAVWSVKLAVELDRLGKLYARVVLANGTISTTLWAERPGTVALANQRLGELQDALMAAELPVGVVCCHQGKPQDSQNPRSWPSLLRVTA